MGQYEPIHPEILYERLESLRATDGPYYDPTKTKILWEQGLYILAMMKSPQHEQNFNLNRPEKLPIYIEFKKLQEDPEESTIIREAHFNPSWIMLISFFFTFAKEIKKEVDEMIMNFRDRLSSCVNNLRKTIDSFSDLDALPPNTKQFIENNLKIVNFFYAPLFNLVLKLERIKEIKNFQLNDNNLVSINEIKQTTNEDFSVILTIYNNIAGINKQDPQTLPSEFFDKIENDVDAAHLKLEQFINTSYYQITWQFARLDYYLQCIWYISTLRAVMAHPPPALFNKFLQLFSLHLTPPESSNQDDEMDEIDEITEVTENSKIVENSKIRENTQHEEEQNQKQLLYVQSIIREMGAPKIDAVNEIAGTIQFLRNQHWKNYAHFICEHSLIQKGLETVNLRNYEPDIFKNPNFLKFLDKEEKPFQWPLEMEQKFQEDGVPFTSKRIMKRINTLKEKLHTETGERKDDDEFDDDEFDDEEFDEEEEQDSEDNEEEEELVVVEEEDGEPEEEQNPEND